MLFGYKGYLRDLEDESGASGAKPDQGASGAGDGGGPSKKLSAAEIQNIPWVKEAIAAKAKLEKMQADQAAAAAKAAQDRLIEQGKFEEALKAERDRVAELTKKDRQRDLEVALLRAGVKNSKAVRMFDPDFDPTKETADEFVARISKEPENAIIFQPQDLPADDMPENQRKGAPPRINAGSVTITSMKQAQSLRRHTDPNIRQAAAAYIEADYAAKHPYTG